MIEVVEDVRNEFKIKLTDKLESEVISFLNSEGGNIFIGIDDDGKIVEEDYLYNSNISSTDNSILKLIMDRPSITQEELSNLLNVNIRTIKRHFKELIDNDYIIRDGINKNGCWKINK